MELNTLFDTCTITKLMRDGTVQIQCKNGLWSVSGANRKDVEREAQRYWIQYYNDGEYAELLGNAKINTGTIKENKL